ncbi:protein phosphatase 2c [Capsaspora owczarzaki ATCC 30864]|uniref:protein-serine/threonine phosphatase n=1 Tax=Capsaspora owczarzaki (strain ATCC 30864) TaxID=595528 RepID=A0A0D2UIL0_CAPO3|nr:protein phosphatase 2c [Capsaspora owczarzaki ATCC 30864]KJE94976.1 protein phosphatase 2c [Capsaspora owczarzaki ATCC 30864]|eukprot:XP_004346184.1 protein phosphatase 2c [Capsaspora owczarzaki ATCC 30864]
MGQVLSEPITDKHTSSGADKRLTYGASAMQGWRINMEDAHTTLLELPGDSQAAFFAVYDGHGGANVARYAGQVVHNKVTSAPEYQQGNFQGALETGFLQTDEDMMKDANMRYDTSGCTAVAVLIKDNTVYCGNAGDSRALLSKNGVAQPLSYDHKPNNPEEFQRIKAAGGFVEFGRVNGNLALSRAIGDFLFKTNARIGPKEQAVTSFPDVISMEITPEVEFVVLACDGIWDVMNNQAVTDFVRQRIATQTPLGEICEQLMENCLARDARGGVGCDNMTVLIIGILNGGTYAELAERCSKPRDPVPVEPADASRPGGAPGAGAFQAPDFGNGANATGMGQFGAFLSQLMQQAVDDGSQDEDSNESDDAADSISEVSDDKEDASDDADAATEEK